MNLASYHNGQLTPWEQSFVVVDGRTIFNPSVETLRSVGVYPVTYVDGTGTDGIDGESIVIHTGNAEYATHRRRENILSVLSDTNDIIAAIERIVARDGVTEEDRAMAQARVLMRDELGKVQQTATGIGDPFDPIKFWTPGMAVEKGKWYQCYDKDGYIWEAIKSGIPANDRDNEYFDVVE